MRIKPSRARSRFGAFLTALVCLALSACGAPAADYQEATIADLHDAMNHNGLGWHEHRNANGRYRGIDYVELDLT